ncbi:MAG: LPS export ABC transporter periplasmic protein LptC [Rhodospirillaceae bacterium]
MTETRHSSIEVSADQNTPSSRGAWQPRSVAIRDSVEKYSRFVSAMKVVLPSVAGLLLALVIILPQLRGEPEQLTADIAITTDDDGGALSLVNARYLGTDTSGQPFTVTAESVREAGGGDDNIDLTAPQADISLNDGTWLMVGADTGRYHRESQTLNLEGAVNLFQDQGYELHTESAVVMLEQGAATSSTPVQTQGPFGRLESQGFDLQDKGKVVFFTGPAKLVLDSAGNGSGG